MVKVSALSSHELFNLLQHQKNWPAGGPPVLYDLRSADAYAARHVRGAHHATLTSSGEIDAPPKSWWDKVVCLYDAEPASLDDHPLCRALVADGQAREVLVLSDSYAAFETSFRFLTARGDSKSAMKRPIYPSCIIPGLLYLGDLADAAALTRLREHLNIAHTVTALAELTPSLKASLAEWKGKHTWCNVRDVEEADIKEHFAPAFDAIEVRRSGASLPLFIWIVSSVSCHASEGWSRTLFICVAALCTGRTAGWHRHLRPL